MPRLPVHAPRSGIASMSPVGVTRLRAGVTVCASVVAPPVVCRGIVWADHRTQPPPAPAWDHGEFPLSPRSERVETGAWPRSAGLGLGPCATDPGESKTV